jgi:hypothetical protein
LLGQDVSSNWPDGGYHRPQPTWWSATQARSITRPTKLTVALLAPLAGLKATPKFSSPDAPDYHYQANDHINRIFARALNLWAGLRDERATPHLHQSFISFWKPELQAWSERWTAISKQGHRICRCFIS